MPRPDAGPNAAAGEGAAFNRPRARKRRASPSAITLVCPSWLPCRRAEGPSARSQVGLCEAGLGSKAAKLQLETYRI